MKTVSTKLRVLIAVIAIAAAAATVHSTTGKVHLAAGNPPHYIGPPATSTR